MERKEGYHDSPEIQTRILDTWPLGGERMSDRLLETISDPHLGRLGGR